MLAWNVCGVLPHQIYEITNDYDFVGTTTLARCCGRDDNRLNGHFQVNSRAIINRCDSINENETHHRLPQCNPLGTSPNRIASILDIRPSDILSIRCKQRCSDSELGVRACCPISENFAMSENLRVRGDVLVLTYSKREIWRRWLFG